MLDSSFVQQKTEEISKKTGLKKEELTVYVSVTRKIGSEGETIFMTVTSPIDLFLNSTPLFTAKKLILNRSEDYLFIRHKKGNPFVVKFRVAPLITILQELRSKNIVTPENKSDYIFEDFALTNVGSTHTRPKHTF
ncbi:MAG: hypothetical protein ACI9V1_000793 [Spirosomataceae bacterium]